MKEDFYAVINVGSTYTIGMVGKKLPDGRVEPILVHTEASKGCVKRGYIYNIEASVLMFNRILESLNARLDEGAKIASVYIGLGCQSMIAQPFTTEISMPEGSIVTSDHLDELYNTAARKEYVNREVVMIMPPYYTVDGRHEINPQGVNCKTLQATFQIITIRKTMIQSLKQVLNQVGVRLAGIIANPVAEADVVLTAEEKMLGCAYVNIGGGCTSVSIYRDRLLRALYVLPFGGQNITRDLTTLRLVEADAEALKVQKASMMLDGIRERKVTISSNNNTIERTLKLLDVNELVAARMKEIMFNVTNLIQLSGYIDQLGSGLIISGGAVRLNSFMTILQEQLPDSRYGLIQQSILSDSLGTIKEENVDKYKTTIGLLRMTKEPNVEYDFKAVFGTNDESVSPKNAVKIDDFELPEEEELAKTITITEGGKEVPSNNDDFPFGLDKPREPRKKNRFMEKSKNAFKVVKDFFASDEE